MKYFNYLYLIYIITLFFAKIISFQNIAVIPFKTFHLLNYKKDIKLASLDYYKFYHSSNIYFDIEVGNKNINQNISLFLNLDDYLFYIEDNFESAQINKNNICKYSTELSDSFKVVNSDNIIIGKNSYCASDYFKIYTNLNKDISKIMKIEFLYYKNNLNNSSFACGKVGILFPSDKKSDLWKKNFLNQINKGIKNKDYSFTLKYDKENKDIEKMDEGLFIIGIEQYEKIINKNNNLIIIYNKADQYCNKQKWTFQIDNIYIGNNQFYQFDDIEININIKIDIEGFEYPKFMFDKLNEIYFNKYYNNNICSNEIIDKNIGFIIIYCNEDKFVKKDIINFPKINLLKYKLGFNFSFSGEDLFYKCDKKYFFKILFNTNSYKKEFNLGKLFIKKYKVIFNPESNYMSFYKIEGIINEKIEEKINSFYSIFFKFIWVSIIFLIVGFYLGRKFCVLRKNKFAKELENMDNLVSEKGNDIITKENKLIDF